MVAAKGLSLFRSVVDVALLCYMTANKRIQHVPDQLDLTKCLIHLSEPEKLEFQPNAMKIYTIL